MKNPLPHLRLLKAPNECLSSVCDPVPEGAECGPMLDAMWALLRERRAWGLAANQVGIMHRMLVCMVDTWALEIINPVIIWRNKGRLAYGREGCLSFPGENLMVGRNRWIKVEGFDRNWNPIKLGAKEVRGRVLQHEIDHLDGISMADRVRIQKPL